MLVILLKSLLTSDSLKWTLGTESKYIKTPDNTVLRKTNLHRNKGILRVYIRYKRERGRRTESLLWINGTTPLL